MPEFLLKISPSFTIEEGDENIILVPKISNTYSFQIVLKTGEHLLEINEDIIAKA